MLIIIHCFFVCVTDTVIWCISPEGLWCGIVWQRLRRNVSHHVINNGEYCVLWIFKCIIARASRPVLNRWKDVKNAEEAARQKPLVSSHISSALGFLIMAVRWFLSITIWEVYDYLRFVYFDLNYTEFFNQGAKCPYVYTTNGIIIIVVNVQGMLKINSSDLESHKCIKRCAGKVELDFGMECIETRTYTQEE